MQSIVDISTLVTQTRGICGGRPCIAGTRTANGIVIKRKSDRVFSGREEGDRVFTN